MKNWVVLLLLMGVVYSQITITEVQTIPDTITFDKLIKVIVLCNESNYSLNLTVYTNNQSINNISTHVSGSSYISPYLNEPWQLDEDDKNLTIEVVVEKNGYVDSMTVVKNISTPANFVSEQGYDDVVYDPLIVPYGSIIFTVFAMGIAYKIQKDIVNAILTFSAMEMGLLFISLSGIIPYSHVYLLGAIGSLVVGVLLKSTRD